MRERQRTSHDALLDARASAPAANSCAPALDDQQERKVAVLLVDGGRARRSDQDELRGAARSAVTRLT
jgi:hypothetical protein